MADQSCMIYRTAPFSTSLSDAYTRFQGHTIIYYIISATVRNVQTQF